MTMTSTSTSTKNPEKDFRSARRKKQLMDPLRLCIVAHIYPSQARDYKGIFVHSIAAALARRGHEVHVVTPRRPGAPRCEVLDGVTIHRFWYWGWAGGRQLSEFKRYPLVLLATQLLVGALSCLWTVLRHRLGVIHAFWVVPGGFIGVLCGMAARRPVVVTAAGTDLNIMARKKIAGWFVRFTLRRLDRLIAAGSDMQRIAVELGMPEPRGVVIPWLVQDSGSGERADADDAGQAQEKNPALGGDKPTTDAFAWPEGSRARLIYVGNLTLPKRVDTILRALAEALRAGPQATLAIVGDGYLRPQLEALCAELGLNGLVRFWGARPHEAILEVLASADVFVHCSDNEGLPVAISEALSAGLPVVASNVGGIPDLVIEGENGFLVGPDDHGRFAERIAQLLRDDFLRKKMSANARRFAHEHLDGGAVIARIEKVYQQVLE